MGQSEGFMRYRLVPSQGPSWHVWDDSSEASILQAQAHAREYNTSVAVCEAPEGGIVRKIHSVKAPKPKKEKS